MGCGGWAIWVWERAALGVGEGTWGVSRVRPCAPHRGHPRSAPMAGPPTPHPTPHPGKVLARDGDNAKALFRRGRARAALGQTEEAIADLERASRL
jgi:hypothetical protein